MFITVCYLYFRVSTEIVLFFYYLLLLLIMLVIFTSLSVTHSNLCFPVCEFNLVEWCYRLSPCTICLQRLFYHLNFVTTIIIAIFDAHHTHNFRSATFVVMLTILFQLPRQPQSCLVTRLWQCIFLIQFTSQGKWDLAGTWYHRVHRQLVQVRVNT